MATSNHDIAKFLPEFDHWLPYSREGEAGRKSSRRLVDHFDDDFRCLSADETSIREAAYRVRYKVYCVENCFEDPTKHPAGLESDEFDSHAPHKLLMHRPSSFAAGVVRLILPEFDLPNHGLPFNSLIGRLGPVGQDGSRQRTAEVSRFAVVRQARDAIRRNADHLMSAAELHESATALMRNISIGIMRGVVEMAAENGVTHLCALMEPALLRLLGRLGVHFQPLGPKVSYHGSRQPCVADLDRLLARTWAERRDVWEVLTGEGDTWPLNWRSALSGVEAH